MSRSVGYDYMHPFISQLKFPDFFLNFIHLGITCIQLFIDELKHQDRFSKSLVSFKFPAEYHISYKVMLKSFTLSQI